MCGSRAHRFTWKLKGPAPWLSAVVVWVGGWVGRWVGAGGWAGDLVSGWVVDCLASASQYLPLDPGHCSLFGEHRPEPVCAGAGPQAVEQLLRGGAVLRASGEVHDGEHVDAKTAGGGGDGDPGASLCECQVSIAPCLLDGWLQKGNVPVLALVLPVGSEVGDGEAR